jgi:hypothetical protein
MSWKTHHPRISPLELNSQQFPCLELKAHDGEHKDALVSIHMEAK